MNFDPVKLCEDLRGRGDEWAEAVTAELALERTLKPLLHKLKMQAKADGIANSDAASETWAYAHPEYMKHVEAWNVATGRETKAKVRYETMKTYLDLLRTQAASERAANARI